MTLTLGGIARARLVLVTVRGEEKRDAFARVQAGDPDCPASRIRADQVVWIVDPAAAG
jgi:6-phosphogluconolactonase/glucosamine-6-phosphate isomerase/deaminase